MKNLLLCKIVILIIIVKTTCIFSQKAWMSETPQGCLNDYFVGSGSSTFSGPDAEKFAYIDALHKISDRKGIIFQPLSDTMKYFSKQTDNDNLRKNERVLEIGNSFKITGATTIITDLTIWDKYSNYKTGLYSVWILVSIPKETPISCPTTFSFVIRSFFVPGWGQLYKGESCKGISFMVLSLGGLAGGFIFNILSQDAIDNANGSRTQITRDFYNQQTKDYDTCSKISFITAAAFYVLNLIDAIAVKQDNFYAELNGNQNLQICYRFNF